MTTQGEEKGQGASSTTTSSTYFRPTSELPATSLAACWGGSILPLVSCSELEPTTWGASVAQIGDEEQSRGSGGGSC